MAVYDPEQWHDFFVTVGGGAAAMTGLLVVAVSMHLQAIAADPVLRHRARIILFGLASMFLRSALVLMGGQGHRAVAAELLAVNVGLAIVSGRSYAPVAHSRASHRSSRRRTIAGFASSGVEMLGATLLFFGLGWGLHVAAIAMMAFFCVIISGAWLLLLGVRQDETRAG